MDAESLFLQFRESREPAALGAVFDLVADDLFAVALHLCRAEAEAADLVQATFLCAMERADRFDGARPLRPWLLGILQNEAKARRRRARRVPDPRRLPQAVEPPPEQRVLAAEARTAVAGAIAQVPQPYRDVLELRPLRCLEPAEIAARLQRSPGAIRTQLWRGLDLLRALLPKGLGATLALELGLRPALAAVRENVLAAAAGNADVLGFGAASLAGALLMQKVWIGVVAAVVLVAGWAAWPEAAVAALPPPAAGTAVSVAAAMAPAGEIPAAPRDAERTLAVEAEPAARPTDTVAPPPPIEVRALVVDKNGDPVADALVELYEAQPATDAAGRPRPAVVRMPNPPLLQVRTDSAGRATLHLDAERFVAAHKAGVGMTGDLRVAPDVRSLRDELRLVLRPSLCVTGTVLGPDGSPASGARVAIITGAAGRSPLPAATVADDGRFRFELVAGPDYVLTAQWGEQRSPGMQIQTANDPGDRDLVLQIPGAFSVRGVLLAPDGTPTAGKVRLLSEPTPNAPSRWQHGRAATDGRFVLLLAEGGRFELFGGIAEQNAVHLPVQLDAAQPHREVTLRLPPLVESAITGRAVDERGEPCNLLTVTASAVRDEPLWIQQGLSGLLGPVGGRANTAADGRFRLVVRGQRRYELGFFATKELWVRGPEVTPPVEDLVLVVRDADRRGFTVGGTVVAAATGAPVPQFRVYLVEHGTEGGHSDRPIATGKDGSFEAGPFPTGKRYSLRIEAEGQGLGDADLGPFDATVRHEQVAARLLAHGSVLCTVLRADGTPAVKAHVGLVRAGTHPFEKAHQGDTDAAGRVRLEGLTPDDYTVHASAEVQGAGAAMVDAVVLPGQETAVQLTLRQ